MPTRSQATVESKLKTRQIVRKEHDHERTLLAVEDGFEVSKPLHVGFIGAYSLTTFGGGVKWFIQLLNLLQSDGRFCPHLFVQDYVDYGRVEREAVRKMVRFDYHEVPHESSQLLPPDFSCDICGSPNSTSNVFKIVYVMTDRPQILQKAMRVSDRVIFGAHDPYLLRLKGEKRKLFEKLWRSVDAIHILSPPQDQFFRYNTNLYALPNTWLGPPADSMKKFSRFTVLFFSRHEVDKGIETVGKVALALPSDIDLYISGSGSKSNFTSDLRRPNVHVTGFIPEEELYSLLARSHVVLFPSRSESGLAMVAVEALAHHTPLVYRDMKENWILRRHPLNVGVDSDSKFLEAIGHLKDSYDADPNGYIVKCSELPSLLRSPESYLDNFINLLVGGPPFRDWDY